MTVDGKITTRNFTPVDFTSREDKQHLFRQRALADAVLIGHSTIERDNVRLGISEHLRQERIERGHSPAPLRVIVSNEGKIDSQLKIFQWDVSEILIFSTERMPKEVRTALKGKASLHFSKSRDVDLAEVLKILRRDYKVRRVACEGGPTLFRSMLEHGLIDRLHLVDISGRHNHALFRAELLRQLRALFLRIAVKQEDREQSGADGYP